MKDYKRCSVKDEIPNEWLHQRFRNLLRHVSPQSIVANRIIFLSLFSLKQNSVLAYRGVCCSHLLDRCIWVCIALIRSPQ